MEPDEKEKEKVRAVYCCPRPKNKINYAVHGLPLLQAFTCALH
jgi:hypothetical protein